MVNVNKNIKPGVKVEPAAPKRRPRNQELNSSKKTLPDSIRSRRRQKLNCSRESVINQLVNEEQIYTQEEAEELIDSFEEQTGATVVRLATMDEVENEDGEFWATKDGKTTLWCRGNGFWYDSGSTDMNSSKKTRMNSNNEGSFDSSVNKDGLNSSIDWSSGYDHESIRPAVTALVERYLANTGASDALLKIGLEEDAGFSSEFNLGVYVYLKQDTDETIQEGLLDELTQKLRRVIMREYNWDATKEWIADNDYKMSVQIAVGDCYDNDTEFGYEIGYHSGIEVECPVDFDSSRKKLNSNVDSRFEKYFDKVTDQQLADFYGIDVEEIIDVNKDIENANYGKVVAHYIPKSEYAEVLVDGDWESLDILDDGTVGFSLGEGGGKATRFYGVDIDTIEEKLAEAGLNSSRTSKKTRMNCSADTKITTESGNEISMGEIKVVQNPSTNELALFIPENDEDSIPEGFTVIGDVVAAGGEEENSEEAESEESEELDSSKKLNSSKRRSSKNLNSNRRRSVKKKK